MLEFAEAGGIPAVMKELGKTYLDLSQKAVTGRTWAEELRDNPGDVIVIRYESPKGGPGMQEMLNPTAALLGYGLGESAALVTDAWNGAVMEVPQD